MFTEKSVTEGADGELSESGATKTVKQDKQSAATVQNVDKSARKAKTESTDGSYAGSLNHVSLWIVLLIENTLLCGLAASG